MNAVPIGQLSHRLMLEAPTRAPDGGGGASVTWSLVGEVWGAILSVSGGESVEADGVRGRITHEIWIRHRDGVVPEMRFVLESRVFDIQAVLEQGGRRRFLKCLVEERTP
jgi:SPP1 family predicted phage head-tail adaptor